MDCLKDRMFWIIWVMAVLSIMLGVITVDVTKTAAISRPNLDHEEFITEVVSIGCIFNAGRAIWAIFLDYYSYKKVYGTLLFL